MKPEIRQALDEIIDSILPAYISAFGLTAPRDTIKGVIFHNLEADPLIELKVVTAYMKLKRIFESK